MWRGERSSWRCTNNGGCRGITRVHRGITKVHRGITKVHSGAARCRRRGVVNPIHATFIKGLGDMPRRKVFSHFCFSASGTRSEPCLGSIGLCFYYYTCLLFNSGCFCSCLTITIGYVFLFNIIHFMFC